MFTGGIDKQHRSGGMKVTLPYDLVRKSTHWFLYDGKIMTYSLAHSSPVLHFI